jgi:hypothetical protein
LQVLVCCGKKNLVTLLFSAAKITTNWVASPEECIFTCNETRQLPTRQSKMKCVEKYREYSVKTYNTANSLVCILNKHIFSCSVKVTSIL